MIFRPGRCSVSSPKPSKSRRIHLLLKQVTWVRIMDVGVILKSLDKTLLVVWTIRVIIELRHSAIIVGAAVGIL